MLDKRIQGAEEEFTRQAVRTLKYNPCLVCGGEGWCGVKYKGTCPIWRELKIRFINVKE